MRRFYVLILALFGLAALPLAANATHKPGHPTPATGNVTSITIAVKPNPFTSGRQAMIAGKLFGVTVGAQTVDLESRPFPFTSGYRTVATALSQATGDYSFSVGGTVNSGYRTSSGGVKSIEILVQVRLAVALSVSDSTPKRGRLVRFSGTVSPEEDGARVLIQRRASTGKFKTVASTTLLDVMGMPYSRYSRKVRVSSTGVYRVRAVSPNENKILSGNSRSKRITVH